MILDRCRGHLEIREVQTVETPSVMEQRLDGRQQVGIVAAVQEDPVEAVVSASGRQRIAGAQGLAHGFGCLFEALDVLVGHVRGGGNHGKGLESGQRFEHQWEVFDGSRHHARVTARDGFDRAELLKHLQRLADRGPADPQLLSDVVVLQRFTRAEGAVLNPVAHLVERPDAHGLAFDGLSPCGYWHGRIVLAVAHRPHHAIYCSVTSVALVVRGGRVIDPAHGVDEVADVVVDGGRVVAVGDAAASSTRAVADIDATGRWVVPGLVDLHVHVSSVDNGAVAHRMLARAGVTTALDLLGEVSDVLSVAGRHGAGLTLGCVDGLTPDRHFGGNVRPSRGAIRDALAEVRRRGGIGVKVHVEHGYSAEVAANVVDEANDLGMWIAIHCGSPATGSNLAGLRESVSYLGGRRAHIAHVNSYCRGEEEDAAAEAVEAVTLLRSVPQVLSESYLAEHNGTSARCRDGRPTSRVRRWLERAGYPATESGLASAIADGWAKVPERRGEGVQLVDGDAALATWRAHGTDTGLCLPVNPAVSAVVLAGSKGPDGFDVDAIATDGGGIPRNLTLERGLLLVEMGLLSVSELVTKASRAGAMALGLAGKGHLGVGADADLVVVDPGARSVDVTVAAGHVVMQHGEVRGEGTTALVPRSGVVAAREDGCVPRPLDVTAAGFYTSVHQSSASARVC